jgi:hypothetical protein
MGYVYGRFLWDILWEISMGYIVGDLYRIFDALYCILYNGDFWEFFFGSNHSNVNIWREIVVIRDMTNVMSENGYILSTSTRYAGIR